MDTLTVIDTVHVAITQTSSESQQWWIIFLFYLVKDIIPIALAAVAAAWLAMWKFRAQKYWELRLDAYNNMLNALEKMYSSVDAKLMEVEELKDINEDERKELEKKWKEGKEYVIKARRLGRLLLSEATLQIVNIEDKFTEVNKEVDSGDWYTLMDNNRFVLKNVIDDLIEQSKKDLGLKS